jgi:drug/metabolite transporter (DMT)-like permease
MYVVSDVVLRVVPPFTLLGLRLLLGLLVLGALAWWLRLPRPAAGAVLRLVGVGVVGFGISVGAQFVGTALASAVHGALITSASPACIVLFAPLLLRERLAWRQIVAVALATLGVLAIVDPTRADVDAHTAWGDAALAVAALTWGLYSVLVRKVSAEHHTLVVTLWAFVGGLVAAVPLAAVELRAPHLAFWWLPPAATQAVDAVLVAGILYLGVVSTAGAMWLWNRAFALVDAAVASLFFFAQPVVGTLLGVVLLGQALTPGMVLGAALIAAGLLLALRPAG